MFFLVLLFAFGWLSDPVVSDKFDDVIKQNLAAADNAMFSGSDTEPTIIEGDIVVNVKLLAEIAEMEKLAADGVVLFDAIKRGTWPNGKIPYTIAPVADAALRETINQAAREFSDKTGGCVEWKYYNSRDIRRFAPHYVTFFIGGGCYSMIGRQARPQKISFGRRCIYKGIAIHEMMHALGFFHEQSRRDRDDYIQINWSYIPQGLWYNFKKYQPGQADTLGEPYDKHSVMHYGNYAFTTVSGRKTIESKSNSRETLGQRKGLSSIDVKQLNKYYNCKAGDTGTTKPIDPKPTSSCKDSYTFCVVLGKYCTDTWVKKNCKSKCGGCVKCFDSSTYAHNCPRWEASGYCTSEKYVSWMGKHCIKTCGKCE